MTPEEYKAQRLAERAQTYRDEIAKLRALVADKPASVDTTPDTKETP